MEDILRLMRIHDPADVLRKYPHQLSGGMLQRVMIGLAICMQPSLIIADEPTTAIDSISQYAIMQGIPAHQAARGSLHDLHLA